ncbi:MAG: NAD(P)-dependent oxidoreductase [Candidatus Pacebacteria bacterium]|nr:NAD(P)-dependent oxidoreductase [Candidatus Paceibacterota bacterium]
MKIKNKKILITGGTGFIGSHLTKELAVNNKVWVLDRIKKENQPGVVFIKSDLTKKHSLSFLDRIKFDYIFHLAGNADLNFASKHPIDDFNMNAGATLFLLEKIKSLKSRPKFVFASSVTVYGKCADSKLKENRSLTIPLSNYGVSKLAAERYVFAFASQYNIRAISLRIFSTYGPGLKRQVIYDFIDKLNSNSNQLEILGDGSQARDMVYIDDQIKNIIKIAQKAFYKGEVYNLCSGNLYTTKELAHCVVLAMKMRPKLVFTNKIRVFDGQSWRGDSSIIKKMGCSTPTSLSTGIKKTVLWYMKEIKALNNTNHKKII